MKETKLHILYPNLFTWIFQIILTLCLGGIFLLLLYLFFDFIFINKYKDWTYLLVFLSLGILLPMFFLKLGKEIINDISLTIFEEEYIKIIFPLKFKIIRINYKEIESYTNCIRYYRLYSTKILYLNTKANNISFTKIYFFNFSKIEENLRMKRVKRLK